MLRIGAVAVASVALVLSGSQLASASSIAHDTWGTPKVSVKITSPTSGSTVHDTVDVTLTGKNLKTVKLYSLLKQVGTAVVSADGLSAVAELDTTKLRTSRGGKAVLSAIAWGANSKWPTAIATPIVLKVDNVSTDGHPAGFSTVVFDDDFGGSSLDRDTWCTRYMYDGGTEDPATWAGIDPECLGEDPETGALLGTLDTLGGTNEKPGQEQEVYRDVNVKGEQMHTVQNGYLSLHATATLPDAAWLKYESSMIRAKQEFVPTEGHPLYLTLRAKTPDVVGTWPAFWLAGGYGDGTVRPPWPPEIDILEMPYNKSGNTAEVLWTATQAWPSWDDAPQGPFVTESFDPHFDGDNTYRSDTSLRDKWIEVGLEWYTDHACWYLDGVKFRCTTYKWLPNADVEKANPAAILINLAVGGGWAGADGVELTEAGATYDIDHVRVYQK